MEELVQRPSVERPKVLVVEDNPADAELAEIYLSAKYSVQVTNRVTGAIAILRTTTFAAVLTDLTLPDACGLEAVTKLQSVAPGPAIIVVTGLNDESIGQRAVELGAQDYLVKGRFDEESLDRAMRYATERKRSEQRLSQLAHYDQLTGLANRATFRDRLQVIIEHARRKDLQFTVMYLDLDDFKSANDSFGHDCGDLILREVGHRLMGTVRGYDTAARLGGDEFALLFDHQGDNITPQQLIDRVVDAFFEPMHVGGETLKIAASIGVATFPQAGDTEAELLKAADIAMFWAKDRLGTSYVFYDRSYAQEALPKRRIEAQLRKAFATNEFVLQFQPVVNLRSQEITSVEALIRWRRDDGSLTPPGEFIPSLESTGLIVDVGAWVIDEACRRVAAWRREGRRVRVAVNISPRQFEVDGLVATAQRALQENALDPAVLEVEITEGLLMRDTLQTKRTLRGLKDLGVRIAIDDFGTGYSSLAYLHRFAVDTLKIDRSFVNRLEEREGAVLTSAIIGLGHKLGLDVIAEGVETAGQLARLLDDGCDYGQGYYLGRPSFDWTVPREVERGHSRPR
jgi:diguanylate cyclase (GGDEF)-like protein